MHMKTQITCILILYDKTSRIDIFFEEQKTNKQKNTVMIER